MFYTKPMIDMLRVLGEECTVFYSYYLDRYFDTLEDPDFDFYDKETGVIRKIFNFSNMNEYWVMLLICGLKAEIDREGEHKRIAFEQLRKLIEFNTPYFYHKIKGDGAKCVLKTISQAEKERLIRSEKG